MDFKQKFEPRGNRIIHGAGQSPEQFEKYWKSVENYKPLMYMVYNKIDDIKEKFPRKINAMLNISKNLIPQIGLNLVSRTKGQQCMEVAKGDHNEEILFLIKSLKELKTPVFLRIGYEFNEQDKYEPKEFILAWKHIVDLFRNNNVTNVAFVWNACTAFNRDIKEIMEFYPGDRYVDWFGNNLFGIRHFKDNKDKVTEDFIKEAIKHKKPVMIGESTAARTGVESGEKSWKEWFEPFFKWVKEHEVVKAFCYINWDWAIDWKQPEWGNCRIEENEEVSKRYIKELKKSKYIHNLPMNKFLKIVYN